MNVVTWFALGLGVANVAVWTAVVVASRRLWRRVKPQLDPLLAMFLPTSAQSAVAERVDAYTGRE